MAGRSESGVRAALRRRRTGRTDTSAAVGRQFRAAAAELPWLTCSPETGEPSPSGGVTLTGTSDGYRVLIRYQLPSWWSPTSNTNRRFDCRVEWPWLRRPPRFNDQRRQQRDGLIGAVGPPDLEFRLARNRTGIVMKRTREIDTSVDLAGLAAELVETAELVAPRRPIEDRIPAPVRWLGKLVPFLFIGLFVWARCFSGLYDEQPDTAVVFFEVTSELNWLEQATIVGEQECQHDGYRQVRVDVVVEYDPAEEFPSIAENFPEMLPTVPEGGRHLKILDRIIVEC